MVDIEQFYDYLSHNDQKIRREIRKNITYDPELFDDVYNDTVIKVADAITDRHKQIEDIRYYFFISCKQNYINAQNRLRKSRAGQVSLRIDAASDAAFEECRASSDVENMDSTISDVEKKAKMLFDAVIKRLEEVFPLNEVDIYVIYYKLKSGGNRISYRTLADIMRVDIKYITKVIQNIKAFMRSDEEIKQLKKKYK